MSLLYVNVNLDVKYHYVFYRLEERSYPMRDRNPRKLRREIRRRKIRLDFNGGGPAASLSSYPVPVGPRRDSPHAIPFSNIQIYLVIQRARHAAGVGYSWRLLAAHVGSAGAPRAPRVRASRYARLNKSASDPR